MIHAYISFSKSLYLYTHVCIICFSEIITYVFSHACYIHVDFQENIICRFSYFYLSSLIVFREIIVLTKDDRDHHMHIIILVVFVRIFFWEHCVYILMCICIYISRKIITFTFSYLYCMFIHVWRSSCVFAHLCIVCMFFRKIIKYIFG